MNVDLGKLVEKLEQAQIEQWYRGKCGVLPCYSCALPTGEEVNYFAIRLPEGDYVLKVEILSPPVPIKFDKDAEMRVTTYNDTVSFEKSSPEAAKLDALNAKLTTYIPRVVTSKKQFSPPHDWNCVHENAAQLKDAQIQSVQDITRWLSSP